MALDRRAAPLQLLACDLRSFDGDDTVVIAMAHENLHIQRLVHGALERVGKSPGWQVPRERYGTAELALERGGGKKRHGSTLREATENDARRVGIPSANDVAYDFVNLSD